MSIRQLFPVYFEYEMQTDLHAPSIEKVKEDLTVALSSTGLNMYSMSPQLSLNRTQGGLSKTIQQLSSGLRINSSFDDPSGMSISEKMRSHIMGLKRAEMNTQNGISYLQTAEGATNEVTSILQRMRELAVQGANGVYTANDISEIQKEIDQLKAEVDRIAESTEFNTKKLLNGDSAGAWNSSNSKIGAVLNGTVADGNYDISVNVDPGKNQIQKSQILTIKNGSQGAEIIKSASGTNISQVYDPSGLDKDHDLRVVVGDSTAWGNQGKVAGYTLQPGSTFAVDEANANYSVSANATGYLVFEFLNPATDYQAKFVSLDGTEGPWQTFPAGAAGTYNDPATGNIVNFELPQTGVPVAGDQFVLGVTSTGDSMDVLGSYKQPGSIIDIKSAPAVSSNESGYFMLEFSENSKSAGITGTAFRVKFISAETGKEGAWVDMKVQDLLGGVHNSTNSDIVAGQYRSNGFNVDFSVEMMSGAMAKVQAGDKFLFAVNDTKDIKDPNVLAVSGAGTVKVDNGPVIVYTAANSLTKSDNDDGKEDITKIPVFTYSLDSKKGDVTKGEITLGFLENNANPVSPFGNGQTLTGAMTIEIRGEGEAATSTTRVKDIANFYNGDGIFICELTQELKIYGNSGNTVMNIEASDMMSDLEEKLTKALVRDLKMGSGDTAIDKKLVDFLPKSEASTGFRNVSGMFIVQTALTGNASDVSFMGDERLLQALGFGVVQKSENNISVVTARDHTTGVLVGEQLTNSDRVKNLIGGLDVFVDTRTGVEAVWNPANGAFDFEASDRIEDRYLNLHIVDARTKIQIGVSEGQTMDISLPSLDTKALGIDKTVIASTEDAQRAITELDSAISKVLSVRGNIGAQITRLESTYNVLQTERENTTSSESQIRDLDVAEATTALASEQMMYQTGIAMLAQANQLPQMALRLING